MSYQEAERSVFRISFVPTSQACALRGVLRMWCRHGGDPGMQISMQELWCASRLRRRLWPPAVIRCYLAICFAACLSLERLSVSSTSLPSCTMARSALIGWLKDIPPYVDPCHPVTYGLLEVPSLCRFRWEERPWASAVVTRSLSPSSSSFPSRHPPPFRTPPGELGE